MATNKHAMIRYQALDKCFRNKYRRFFMEDLIEACNQAVYEFTGENPNIQRRQIYDDINYMESPEGWSIPLEKIRYGKKKYYRYSKKFSINEKPLDEEEMDMLTQAIAVLNRFKGLPQFEWMESLLTNLEDKLQIKGNDSSIIGFEQNIDYLASSHISKLFFAIINKQVLKLKYRTFKGNERDWIIHPYYIKQYNNRWFLLGMTKSHPDQITTFALDRIISYYAVEDEEYIENKTINFDEYFDDIIGITLPKDGKIEKVILKFSASRYPYIVTKPPHGSMKLIDKENHIIQLNIIPNRELENLILSYGNDVEVLEPLWLREQIKSKLKETIQKYF